MARLGSRHLGAKVIASSALFLLLGSVVPAAAVEMPSGELATLSSVDLIESLSRLTVGSEVTLNLSPQWTVVIRGEEVVRRSGDSFTWFGTCRGTVRGPFQFTVERDGVVGGVTDPNRGRFRIGTDARGRLGIRRVDLDGDDPLRRPCQVAVPDLATPPQDHRGDTIARVDDGSILDVMVVYTPAARDSVGGSTAIDAAIRYEVDATNFAYASSQIAPRIRLVYIAETAYTESGIGSTDLDRLANPADGFMDEVHALRDTYGADMVSLFVAPPSDVGGIAYIMKSTSGFDPYAFSVTVTWNLGTNTFAHELGHNQGCCHAVGDGGGCNVSAGGLYSYSNGYRFFGNSGIQWRTVMAYTPGNRINYFSTPNVIVDGQPVGVAIGQAGEADNVSTINSTAVTAANWRASVCTDSLPTVALTSPTGGGVLCPGATATSSWTTSDEFFYFYALELSTDGGTSWVVQHNGSGGGTQGSFGWVPTTPTTQAMTRVTVTNCAGSAVSTSGVFTIDEVAPVTLTAPVGGETLCAGESFEIVWDDSAACPNVFYRIQYSSDGGSTWIPVAFKQGPGSHLWTVPSTTTSQGRIRVETWPATGLTSDTSGDFSISIDPPQITLLGPVGGESFCGGTLLPISWSDSGSVCPPDSFRVEYSSDSGLGWTTLSSGPGNGGLYLEWLLPVAPTTQGRVRVTLSSAQASSSDTSATDFSITTGAAPSPVLVSPNGGEVWGAGSVHDITWTNGGCDAVWYDIEYSSDGGATWFAAGSDSGAGLTTFPWTVPASATTQGLIRVTLSNLAGSAAATSDALFSVTGAPTAVLSSPSGGEIWVQGSQHPILWQNSGGGATSHDLDYSTDAGSTWSTIAAGLPGDGGGSYVWTVSGPATTTARVRLTLSNDAGSSTVQSAGNFTIAAGADFVDVTTTSAAGGPFTSSRGVAWIDHDGDGAEDLFVTQSLSANLLLRNDGYGDLSSVAPSALGDAAGDGYMTAWADFDNDGDPDAYIVNTGGANRLLRNDGGIFSDVSVPPLDDAGDGRAAAWADYDLDGDVDLYLANSGGPNRLFRNDGGATFADVTTPPADDPGFTNGAVWADADADGDPDLYLVSFGANRLLRNDQGTLVDATVGVLGDSSPGTGAAWGDYDNDGDPDLYVTNSFNVANVLIRNDGGGQFGDASSAPVSVAGYSAGGSWADVDADGDLDLYVVLQNAANRFFRNDGSGFVDASAPPLNDAGVGESAAWGDADGNGRPDVYLANGAANVLLFNYSAPGNHWLGVRLEGTSTNRSAIGARVRLLAGAAWQFREVSAGSGHGAQGSLVAHFGLGTAAAVDSIEVTWPGGGTHVVTGLPADQVVVVVESDPTTVSTTDAPHQLRLYSSAPNPFRGATMIRYDLPAEDRVRLGVYDVVGRRIRVLVDDVRPAGRYRVEWDGKDELGRTVSSGIYFTCLQASGSWQTGKLVHLR